MVLTKWFCRLPCWSRGIELAVVFILIIHLVSLLTWVHHGNWSFSFCAENLIIFMLKLSFAPSANYCLHILVQVTWCGQREPTCFCYRKTRIATLSYQWRQLSFVWPWSRKVCLLPLSTSSEPNQEYIHLFTWPVLFKLVKAWTSALNYWYILILLLLRTLI